MAKVTSKLQITLPKRLAEQYGITSGDEIEFVPSGESIRLLPKRTCSREQLNVEERLRLFDQATQRQADRNRNTPSSAPVTARDWTREELYTRGKPR